jgi:hypothetical protein
MTPTDTAAETTFNVWCPCGHKLEIPEDTTKRKFPCPRCRQKVAVAPHPAAKTARPGAWASRPWTEVEKGMMVWLLMASAALLLFALVNLTPSDPPPPAPAPPAAEKALTYDEYTLARELRGPKDEVAKAVAQRLASLADERALAQDVEAAAALAGAGGTVRLRRNTLLFLPDSSRLYEADRDDGLPCAVEFPAGGSRPKVAPLGKYRWLEHGRTWAPTDEALAHRFIPVRKGYWPASCCDVRVLGPGDLDVTYKDVTSGYVLRMTVRGYMRQSIESLVAGDPVPHYDMNDGLGVVR